MNFIPQRFWGVARVPLAAPSDHPAVIYGRIGVLLLNLGTPDGTSYWPMRRYLKEFLSDRRADRDQSLIWSLILNMVVLTKRPFTSGDAYRSVWNSERDERRFAPSRAANASMSPHSRFRSANRSRLGDEV